MYQRHLAQRNSYKIRIHGIFESAHYLYNYYPDGSDEDLHGHTWEAEVFIESQKLVNGISVDFLDVRKKFDSLVQDMDHICINEYPPFNESSPTAENIANYFFQKLKGSIPKDACISEVRIWEGPKNWASYIPT